MLSPYTTLRKSKAMQTPPIKPVFYTHPKLYIRFIMGICVTCPNSIEEKHFTDELSKTEYNISGMCQDCQDLTFKLKRGY